MNRGETTSYNERMMTHLLLGGNGQLATSFLRLLGPRCVALDRRHADLLEPASLRSVLDRHRPTFVLNCGAYNQVDKAESDAGAAWTVNALAPAALAVACHATNAFLVHFSTNYVFGLEQKRNTPYRENDLPGPLGVYGSTKLAGEHFVLARCPRSLVIRTCGLFGRRAPGTPPSNFVATMARMARQGKPLRVVDDQICTPTSSDDLARATLELIAKEATGLFHVTNSGQCSWFEFAAAIFEELDLTADLTTIKSVDYPAPARRPAYSVLDCGKVFGLGLGGMRSWRAALKDHLSAEGSS